MPLIAFPGFDHPVLFPGVTCEEQFFLGILHVGDDSPRKTVLIRRHICIRSDCAFYIISLLIHNLSQMFIAVLTSSSFPGM